MTMSLRNFVIVGFFAALVSCTKKTEMTAAESLVHRGRTVYVSNCTACHNADPKRDGSIGPSVWGSSQELLTAKMIRKTYPEGYKPKRETAQMAALPHLEAEIPALAAYLNSN